MAMPAVWNVRMWPALAGLIVVLLSSPAAQVPAGNGWELVVLGVAQDAGSPQLGCQQDLCVDRRAGKRPVERVSSIGLVHRGTGRAFLFDATPDMPSQLESLTGGRAPDGIFLTHGHIGHYTGLMYLGRESTSAANVPVYGTARMQTFLSGNGPWSQLVTLKNIAPVTIVPDTTIALPDGLRVTPFLVPHRDEFTDTVGYRIAGPRKTAVFIPDIDQWSKWDRDIRTIADEVDYLFLDGTFASADEIPGRSIADIPHPMMPVTRDRLKGTRAALWFIHLNHTNRELDAPDVVKDGARFIM
jgi:pyrroloquinoline quinone biosynthesis protein B